MKFELKPNPCPNAMKLLETMAEHGEERHTLQEWCDMANIRAASGYGKMVMNYAPYFGLVVNRYHENGHTTFALERHLLDRFADNASIGS